jgi:hypothetical protein
MNSRINLIQINKGGTLVWQIKQSVVKIANMNSFSMKVNRLSTKKKDSKTNRKGALNVELRRSSKWETGAVAATVAVEEIGVVTEVPVVAVTGGKQVANQRRVYALLFNFD